MRTNYILIKQSLTALALVLVVFMASCKKNEPTTCVVTVNNLKLAPVAGADVLLHAKDIPLKPGDYQYKGKTDSKGQVSFEIPLEAIYTIEASKDSLYGRDRVRLIRGENVDVIVTLE